MSRAPHGARGLKLLRSTHRTLLRKSRPAWGAWIETLLPFLKRVKKSSRAPHGARGLKPQTADIDYGNLCRAPHGARGLKLRESESDYSAYMSRPAWGAWIETLDFAVLYTPSLGRAPHGARGLKLYF